MRKLNILIALLLYTCVTQGYGGYSGRRYYEPTPYFHIGAGSALAGSTILSGGDLLIAGDARGVLIGINASAYAGNSSNTYGYTFADVKYTLRNYCLGANVGIRLTRTDNFELTIHCLFGEQFCDLGSRDSIDGKRYGKYRFLSHNNFFYVKPAIGLNNRCNFSLMASYNVLFNDNLFGAGKPSFGNSPADFGGPALSVLWLTSSKNHHYHYRRSYY